MYTFDLSDGTGTVHVTAFFEPPGQSRAVTVDGPFEAAEGTPSKTSQRTA